MIGGLVLNLLIFRDTIAMLQLLMHFLLSYHEYFQNMCEPQMFCVTTLKQFFLVE